MTKSELARRRQQEIESAWGGMSLGDAMSSSPYKRYIPSNNTNNARNARAGNFAEAIRVPNGSDIDAQMDRMNQPVRLAENLYRNYDLIGEHNALEDEYEDYMKEMEDAKDPFDEEDKDENYWDQMYQAFNRNHTNTNPPHPRSTAQRAPRVQSNNVQSQDNRPIRLNPTGQYNLNFIDWNNEWERAYDAMEAEGKLFF